MSRDSDEGRSRTNEVRDSGESDADAGSESNNADAGINDAEGPSEGGDGPPDSGSDDGESEWRFDIDDVGPDGVTEDTATPTTEPIEPGSIEFEHAAFVVLGVAITVGVLLFGF